MENIRTTRLRDEGRSTRNFPASDDQDFGIVSKTRTGISPMESIIWSRLSVDTHHPVAECAELFVGN